MTSPGSFEFRFSDWLEANGVAVGDLIGDDTQPAADMRFTATIDLIALRMGIAQLVIRSGGSLEALAR